MAKIKTTETAESVTDFINRVQDETKRNDSFQLIELMQKLTGYEPKMWGPSIIGFGNYHYKYASGHEGDMPLAAFSPRSTSLVVYAAEDYENRDHLMQSLGKYKSGKVCIYIKKLADVDVTILQKMIMNSIKATKALYPN